MPSENFETLQYYLSKQQNRDNICVEDMMYIMASNFFFICDRRKTKNYQQYLITEMLFIKFVEFYWNILTYY